MTERARDAKYLRDKAKQFRRLAIEYDTAISKQLLDIAEELEKRADDIERGKGR